MRSCCQCGTAYEPETPGQKFCKVKCYLNDHKDNHNALITSEDGDRLRVVDDGGELGSAWSRM